jgi:hypothetical protein
MFGSKNSQSDNLNEELPKPQSIKDIFNESRNKKYVSLKTSDKIEEIPDAVHPDLDQGHGVSPGIEQKIVDNQFKPSDPEVVSDQIAEQGHGISSGIDHKIVDDQPKPLDPEVEIRETHHDSKRLNNKPRGLFSRMVRAILNFFKSMTQKTRHWFSSIFSRSPARDRQGLVVRAAHLGNNKPAVPSTPGGSANGPVRGGDKPKISP